MQKLPKITIVLATYQPKEEWFCELLESLRKQTYPNYEVLIWDDASGIEFYAKIEQIVKEKLESIPYIIYQNVENIGSNGIFEKLTCLAKGEYIAYCDQDDIWEEQKLEILYQEAVTQNAIMVYSDMSVIDEKGTLCYQSLRQYRKRIRYRGGENLTPYYLFSNCSAGCSMMIKTFIAQRAVPFFSGFVYDQWLSVYASAYGKIKFIDQTLVRYRRHSNNQSGVLKGIESKETYFQKIVFSSWNAIQELEKRNIHYKKEQQVKEFAKARVEQNIKIIWKYRCFCKKYAYFEILIKYLKSKKVSCLLRWIQQREKRKEKRWK